MKTKTTIVLLFAWLICVSIPAYKGYAYVPKASNQRSEERQKGNATAALVCMENDAKNHGCTESRLYVLMHNQPGVNLYTKFGYIPFRNMDNGMYMRKEL
jgi:hypothetical protein